MKKFKKLIIACDGESASGKSTAAKLISKKYKLLLINSGLLYRYASKEIINHKPKNSINFLKKRFKNISYKKIVKLNLHSEQISNHAAIIAKNKNIRKIINTFQKTLIKRNKKICVEGRDIASKILAKNPKYDLAFYFKCNIKVASYRRWLDIKKKVSLQNVRKSLIKRTSMDKKRKNSPLVKVKDAILIRTDKFTKKQVLSKMSEHIDSLN
ncbi:(d)CMP kinase [Candidatus Pelagibacter sp.]|uniref:(d)CMP kinase n=1 Tax=Candidatus Pelagibacter sp. TaxID=2024849 RepID=UPI003F87A4FA